MSGLYFNKSFLVKDFASSNDLHFMFLTETLVNFDAPLIETCPRELSFLNSPRLSGHGVGRGCTYF